MDRRVRPFGRVKLTPFQCKAWLTLAGAVPGGVTTVDQLLQWVRAHKALLIAEGAEDSLSDRQACLDALFEWSTGVEMPDVTGHGPVSATSSRTVGGLTCHAGGRAEMERELFALVMSGQGNGVRASLLCELLDRRALLTVVPSSG